LPTSQQLKTFFVSNTNNNPARELIFVGSVDNRRTKKSKAPLCGPAFITFAFGTPQFAPNPPHSKEA
jgi:hypothetical protein